MKKSIYVLLFIHIIVFVISCDKSENPDMSGSPSGYATTTETVTNNGCKSYYTRNSSIELVQLKTLDSKTLQVKHLNAMLNCQPGKITFDCQAGKGTITISEKTSENSVNCICAYDLNYIVKIPSYGTYKLKINDTEFGEFKFESNTDVTLNKYLTFNI